MDFLNEFVLLLPFIIRLLAGPSIMVYLHKKFSDKKAVLATAPS